MTRIADLTPLDPLAAPVFSAVTPLARDLTSHLGKGKDAVSARVSAMMEAVERVSAERPPPGAAVTGSFDQLRRLSGPEPLDPASFLLPEDTTYDARQSFTWLPSHDLVTDRDVLMAADLVLSPPSEGILREVDTNGLAAGNTRLEAVVHGLCEVIERDARSQLDFATLFADSRDPRPPVRGIDPATLPDESAEWVERCRHLGLDSRILELTHDLGVPIFETTLVDCHFPTASGPRPELFPGHGCAPCARGALLRSITEACQSRLAFIQGGRDGFNAAAPIVRPAARAGRLERFFPPRLEPFSDARSFRSRDLADDARHLLDRLTQAGFPRVVVTDLTRPDLDVPVVRVRVPGLEVFEVNRRRVGWRCARYLL